MPTSARSTPISTSRNRWSCLAPGPITVEVAAGQPGRPVGWLLGSEIFVLVTAIYYIAAQIGLSLQAQPEAIAVFWPAAGVAVGTLIWLGRRAVVPVGSGVAVGSFVAGIMSRDDPTLSLIFALCNTFECVTVAFFVRCLFGDNFDFDRFPRVIGFLLSALLGSSIAALPAALALKVLAGSSVPLPHLWLVWMESDAIGIVTVAPLLVTIPALLREPPPLAGWLEGLTLLAALGLASLFVFGGFLASTTGRIVPIGSALFPILLWNAARSPPAFAAAASVIISIVLVACMIAGFGPLGDQRLPLLDRVKGAQITMLIGALCSLSLAALFAERRRAERVLMNFSIGLEARVAERTQALTDANHRLARESAERAAIEEKLADYRNDLSHVQRVATAGELATFIAHEINQPLMAISKTAGACVRLNRDGRLAPSALSEHLTDIAAEAKRASDIISHLHSLVRKRQAIKAPVDLARVVEDTFLLLRPLAERRGITLVHTVKGPLPRLYGDDIQLGQLVLNLTRNAMDAVSDQPADSRRVTIATAALDDAGVRFEVTDSGPGLSEEVRRRIPEAFFTTKPDGLGMGLAISQTIAETHGTALEFASNEKAGTGTVVRVVFRELEASKQDRRGGGR